MSHTPRIEPVLGDWAERDGTSIKDLAQDVLENQFPFLSNEAEIKLQNSSNEELLGRFTYNPPCGNQVRVRRFSISIPGYEEDEMLQEFLGETHITMYFTDSYYISEYVECSDPSADDVDPM